MQKNLISTKTLSSGENFLWNNIIWYALYSKFATFTDFGKTWNLSTFEKKIQIL